MGGRGLRILSLSHPTIPSLVSNQQEKKMSLDLIDMQTASPICIWENLFCPGVVVHVCSCRTWEMKSGGSEIQEQPQLHGQILSQNTKPPPKKKKKICFNYSLSVLFTCCGCLRTLVLIVRNSLCLEPWLIDRPSGYKLLCHLLNQEWRLYYHHDVTVARAFAELGTLSWIPEIT